MVPSRSVFKGDKSSRMDFVLEETLLGFFFPPFVLQA
uniref:Uncharacterized protein n=1 Tax=Anguilla anguilla TaxID=7936 RepID=A0A0E9SBH6_ANGAN